jgi:hypothetical protein
MRNRPSAFLARTLFLAASGCVGTIGEVGDPPPGDSPPPPVVTATEGATSGPSATPSLPAPLPPADALAACKTPPASRDLPLRRLSARQFVNNINAAIGFLIPAKAATIITEVKNAVTAFPADAATPPDSFGALGFTRADQLMSQRQADAHHEAAVAVGRALTSAPDRLQALFGTCAVDTNRDDDVACAAAALRRWGPRVLRAPLAADDAAFFAGAADPRRGGTTSRAGFADVLALLFASPPFLFHLEGGADDPAAPAARLDPYELASRLSFQLTDGPPDDELWTAALDGSLLVDGVYAAQVQRLLASPGAIRVRDLFFDEWLGLSARTPDPLAKIPFSEGWKAFVKPVEAQLKGAREEMIEDVLEMARAAVAQKRPVRELLTNRQSFARKPWVAGVYGAPAWDGIAPPAAPASAAYVGLLTRPAFTASGELDTHPITKAVRIRTQLYCDPVPAPPAGLSMQSERPKTPQSTRQKIEALTEQPDTVCAACHASLINPLGFATENFDGLGRERTTEAVYEGAALRAQVPVSTRTALGDGAAAVAADLLRSGTFESCFATQYFRFATAKRQEGPDDACRVSALAAVAKGGASVEELIKALVMAPDFRRRALPR